jgi:hypothetical protein
MLNPMTPLPFFLHDTTGMGHLVIVGAKTVVGLGGAIRVQRICGTSGSRKLSMTISTVMAHSKRIALRQQGQGKPRGSTI